MNPSPFDGSLDGPSSPVVAPQERNTALYSHRQSAPGVQPQIRVPPRGQGKSCSYFGRCVGVLKLPSRFPTSAAITSVTFQRYRRVGVRGGLPNVLYVA